ncbi:MAG: DUF2959 family protein [Burkholderiales bacterium]
MLQRTLVIALAMLLLGGCQTAYYAAMEKVGYQRRDILQSRVKLARDAQEEGTKEVVSALEQFSRTVDFKARYDGLIAVMKTAESQLEPALRPLREQGLFIKHNLNPRALASLKGEFAKVDAQGNQPIAEINRATAKADRFIQHFDKEPA